MTSSIVILVSVLVSMLLIIYILNAIVNSRIKNKISGIEPPVAVDIIKSVLFLSGGLLLNEVSTSFETLTKVLPNNVTGTDLLIKEFSYFSIFVGITLLIIVLTFWLASLIFSVISKGKSIFIEVSNDNFYAIILFAGLMLSLTVAIKSCLAPLFDQFIPYPTMPVYH